MRCWLLISLTIAIVLCSQKGVCAGPADGRAGGVFSKGNLVAWCVVPFDARKRTPAERTQMLRELGFRSLAWDWRQEHLALLEEEIAMLREARIDLAAVWCWIDGRSDTALGEANEQLLAILQRTGAKTEIWVSFSADYFAGLDDEEKVAKGAKTVAILRTKAKAIGCTVSLYNHGDWFGEPRNMLKVLDRLNAEDVGLIYNFHHAHQQLDEYSSNLAMMMPYLRTVNLNGMRTEGPKILPLGAGDHEETMMRQLKEAGFKGRIGVLGHVEDADVRDILAGNLVGMERLLRRMGETESLATY